MWPWEHLALGYLVYSLGVGLLASHRPTASETWALALGTQFPDLVDKPLAWTFEVLPSGVSLAHSVFVAIPLSVAVVLGSRRAGVTAVGAAFAVGYLSHLPADVFYPLALGRPAKPRVLLWPLVDTGSPVASGILGNFRIYFESYAHRLTTSEGAVYLAAELGLLLAAFGRWVADGTPGLPSNGSDDSVPSQP